MKLEIDVSKLTKKFLQNISGSPYKNGLSYMGALDDAIESETTLNLAIETCICIEHLTVVDGYWKNNKESFSHYIIASFDEGDIDLGQFGSVSDNEIFYYGISRKELLSLVNQKESEYEFVITKVYSKKELL